MGDRDDPSSPLYHDDTLFIVTNIFAVKWDNDLRCAIVVCKQHPTPSYAVTLQVPTLLWNNFPAKSQRDTARQFACAMCVAT